MTATRFDVVGLGNAIVDVLARAEDSDLVREGLSKGTMALIGRAAAIADIGGIHLTGFIAWLMWLFVHILYLVGFRNRVLVLLQWAWSYVTYRRGARLITGESRAGGAP